MNDGYESEIHNKVGTVNIEVELMLMHRTKNTTLYLQLNTYTDKTQVLHVQCTMYMYIKVCNHPLHSLVQGPFLYLGVEPGNEPNKTQMQYSMDENVQRSTMNELNRSFRGVATEVMRP